METVFTSGADLEMEASHGPKRMHADVTHLATSNGRMVGTPGHEQARDYLLGRLHELGLKRYINDCFELPYQYGDTYFVNVLAQIEGKQPDLAPLLLAAHYDTAGPFPGADDNAAAVAILLSLAERLQARDLERNVVLAFFDAEEPPHFLSPAMGSVHFYHHQRTGPIHCAIVMDLVGHDVPVPGLEDLLFVTGLESDPGLGKAIEATPSPERLRVIPALNTYVGDMSDHHVFRVNRRPYLFLSCGHWDHYHQPSDTPEKLNYDKTAAVADYLLELTDRIARTPLDGPFEGYDSTPIELRHMRASLGPLLAGLELELESREDIDDLARMFTNRFGL